MILIYWSVFIAIFAVGGATVLTDAGYSVDAPLNDSTYGVDETDTGGLFSTGVSFGRFIGFALFGIGLPSSTPTWMAILISIWQTLWTIFTAGFLISSIWDG